MPINPGLPPPAPLTLHPPPPPAGRRLTALALAFCALFAAFFTVQNLLTSVLDANLAFTTLAVLYFALAAANLVSGSLVKRFQKRRRPRPLKHLQFSAAITYTCWHVGAMLAAFKIAAPVLFPLSLLIALGAAVLWISQAVAVAGLGDDSKLGERQGFFFFIFGFAPMIGQGLVLLLTEVLHVSNRLVFVYMAVLSGIAAFLFLLLYDETKIHQLQRADIEVSNTDNCNNHADLQPVACARVEPTEHPESIDANVDNSEEDNEPVLEAGPESRPRDKDVETTPTANCANPHPSLLRDLLLSVKDTLSLLPQPLMLRLMPMALVLGLPQSFFYGTVTARMPLQLTVQSLLISGACSLSGSLGFGILSDRMDRRLVIFLIVVAVSLAVVLSILADAGVSHDNTGGTDDSSPRLSASAAILFRVAYVFFGLSEGGMHTQSRAAYALLFPNHKEQAVSILMGVFGLGVGAGFLYGRHAPLTVQGAIIIAMGMANTALTARIRLNTSTSPDPPRACARALPPRQVDDGIHAENTSQTPPNIEGNELEPRPLQPQGTRETSV